MRADFVILKRKKKFKTEQVKLLKTTDAEGRVKISGARVRDEITGEEIDVRAKCVVNATGPFTDSIRQMDEQSVAKICSPSAGVHIVLPGYYSPESMGLLDPSTSDGRVIFFLPWQVRPSSFRSPLTTFTYNSLIYIIKFIIFKFTRCTLLLLLQGLTIAGTTDSPCEVTHSPSPTEKDIQFILQEIRNYLNPDIEVRRGDVLSAWSGIRPLVSDPNKPDTQSLARYYYYYHFL